MVLKTCSTITTQYCAPPPASKPHRRLALLTLQSTPKTSPLLHTRTHTHLYCLVQSYSSANICCQCWLMVRSQNLNDSWDYTNWKQLTFWKETRWLKMKTNNTCRISGIITHLILWCYYWNPIYVLTKGVTSPWDMIFSGHIKLAQLRPFYLKCLYQAKKASGHVYVC